MSIELRQLRYAVLAADSQSFARAAVIVNLKQSTLSRKVKDLEIRIGVKLFERSTAVRKSPRTAESLSSKRAESSPMPTIF